MPASGGSGQFLRAAPIFGALGIVGRTAGTTAAPTMVGMTQELWKRPTRNKRCLNQLTLTSYPPSPHPNGSQTRDGADNAIAVARTSRGPAARHRGPDAGGNHYARRLQAVEPTHADDPPRVRSPTPSGQSAVPFSALVAGSAATFQAPPPSQLSEAEPLDPAAYPPLPPAGEVVMADASDTAEAKRKVSRGDKSRIPLPNSAGSPTPPQAHLHDSISLLPIELEGSRGVRVAWRVYAVVSTNNPAHVRLQRLAFRETRVVVPYSFRGIVRADMSCGVCRSIDHPGALCPFPLIHGMDGAVGGNSCDRPSGPSLPRHAHRLAPHSGISSSPTTRRTVRALPLFPGCANSPAFAACTYASPACCNAQRAAHPHLPTVLAPTLVVPTPVFARTFSPVFRRNNSLVQTLIIQTAAPPLFFAVPSPASRARYRTECWLEQCLFRDVLCPSFRKSRARSSRPTLTGLRKVIADQITLSIEAYADRSKIQRRGYLHEAVKLDRSRSVYEKCP
ncbi:hypothetical protein C8F04DRAFT_1190858 [Mycena alexandri]|uniref:Uncharacterized protein n=1 Tax=Mycena alexandri TaxID=1745969 RepID=A0AAD6SDN8_9AGAR|nr:hypothetical protein C8F04DRAFT_1190858 [Mycena alexandri]